MPGDPAVRVTIRALSYRELQRAQDVMRRRSLEDLQALGGGAAALFRELEALGGAARVEQARRDDPLLTHDALTVCEAGVVRWSYADRPLPRSLQDLTREPLEALARAILALSDPAYSPDPEGDKKNA